MEEKTHDKPPKPQNKETEFLPGMLSAPQGVTRKALTREPVSPLSK